MQVSLAARVRSREHASLFANLALAEDLGATRGTGRAPLLSELSGHQMRLVVRRRPISWPLPTRRRMASRKSRLEYLPGRLRCFQMRSPGISPKGFAEERVRVDLRGQNRSRRYSY